MVQRREPGVLVLAKELSAAIEKHVEDREYSPTYLISEIGAKLSRVLIGGVLDQIENPLLFIESEIKSNFPDLNLITLIADVTDKTSIENILSNHHPHIILHAAAHKHVPFM